MKKNFVKALSLVLSIIASASVFTGCGSNSGDSTVLQINWTIGGYGREYCEPLMKAFTEKQGQKILITYQELSEDGSENIFWNFIESFIIVKQ